MNPPTKFQKMRANRVKGERRVFDAAIRAHIAAQEALTIRAPDPEPAGPTMEIDGGRYREGPEINVCEGCEFYDSTELCGHAAAAARTAFGGACYERPVIYLRAD